MTSRERYRAILEKLPDDTRAIFLLHRAEGLDYQSIAGICGIAVADVERHIADAIAFITTMLDADR